MLLRLLLPLLGFILTFATSGSAVTTRATDPVGFMGYQLSAGLQTIGFPLLEPVTTRGRITATHDATLVSTVSAYAIAKLDATRRYYLELVRGPDGESAFVGDRLEVDVAATRTDGSGAIHVALDSTHSTLNALPAELLDYDFVIRPHLTLASVFGTGNHTALRGGPNATTGDQVYALRNGSFEMFLLRQPRGASSAAWVKFPEGTPADDTPISPGSGLFVRRMTSAPVTFRHVGYVRTNDFVQPLAAGPTLASEPFPVSASFASRGMTELNGFEPGTNIASADSVSLWSNGAYRTLFFARTAPNTAPAWRSAETSVQNVDAGSDAAFSPFCAALIQKLAPDPAYVVPSPW